MAVDLTKKGGRLTFVPPFAIIPVNVVLDFSSLGSLAFFETRAGTEQAMFSGEATIFNLQEFATDEGPGIRTAIFFKGCPMRCLWCPNPESQVFAPEVIWRNNLCLKDKGCFEVCPTGALYSNHTAVHIDTARCTGCGRCVAFCPSSALQIHGRAIYVRELVDLVARDVTFYRHSEGGVTLSGGEPLAQPEAALELLKALHDLGIHTAVTTCGAAAASVVNSAAPNTDLFLFSIKTVDPELHLKYTSVPFERVVSLARVLNATKVPVWIRTPIVPGCTDEEGHIRAIARFVSETFEHCERHELLVFPPLCRAKYAHMGRSFKLPELSLPSVDVMKQLCDAAREEGSVNVHWSGAMHMVEDY